MKVKGTAVKTVLQFVSDNYKDRYQEWFDSLSSETQVILKTVLSNEWYPLQSGIVAPTEKIGEFFFEGDITKAAFECGKYSAFIALNGVYKLYVRLSSPGHVVDRGSRILSAYYNPLAIKQIERTKNFVKFEISECDGLDQVVEYRIAGWMLKALEVSGSKTNRVEVTESVKTHSRTIFEASWS